MSEPIFGGHLVPSVSIENLIAQRNAVIAKLNEAVSMIVDCYEIGEKHGFDIPNFSIFREHRIAVKLDREDAIPLCKERIQKDIDRGGWRHLMLESGLYSLMDSDARQSWDRSLQDGNFPELTIENIEATFQELYAARREMFDRGVINCFRRLSWDYKTNKPFCFGKRIVVRRFIDSLKGRDRVFCSSPNYYVANELDDLARVMAILDGKPEADYRNAVAKRVSQAMKECPNSQEAELDYFRIRWFWNGNAHVTFTRPDLVDRMNEIIARHFPGAIAHDRHAA